MTNFIAYAFASISLWFASIATLRAGIVGDFSRGLLITGLVVLPFILVFCVARILKIREERNWLANMEEAL